MIDINTLEHCEQINLPVDDFFNIAFSKDNIDYTLTFKYDYTFQCWFVRLQTNTIDTYFNKLATNTPLFITYQNLIKHCFIVTTTTTLNPNSPDDFESDKVANLYCTYWEDYYNSQEENKQDIWGIPDKQYYPVTIKVQLSPLLYSKLLSYNALDHMLSYQQGQFTQGDNYNEFNNFTTQNIYDIEEKIQRWLNINITKKTRYLNKIEIMQQMNNLLLQNKIFLSNLTFSFNGRQYTDNLILNKNEGFDIQNINYLITTQDAILPLINDLSTNSDKQTLTELTFAKFIPQHTEQMNIGPISINYTYSAYIDIAKNYSCYIWSVNNKIGFITTTQTEDEIKNIATKYFLASNINGNIQGDSFFQQWVITTTNNNTIEHYYKTLSLQQELLQTNIIYMPKTIQEITLNIVISYVDDYQHILRNISLPAQQSSSTFDTTIINFFIDFFTRLNKIGLIGFDYINASVLNQICQATVQTYATVFEQYGINANSIFISTITGDLNILQTINPTTYEVTTTTDDTLTPTLRDGVYFDKIYRFKSLSSRVY